MEIEILRIINEGIYPDLLMLIKSIVLMTAILAIIIVPTYLAGVAWLCFEELCRPRHRPLKRAPELPNPDDPELVATLTALEESNVNDAATDYTNLGQTFPTRSWKPSLRQLPGVPQ